MNPHIDPAAIKQQIHNLLVQFPELADDDQLRADTIEGATSLDEALRTFVRKIGETECLAQAAGDYAKELRERKSRLVRRAEAYRALIFDLMQTAGLRKMELPEATLSVRKVPPKVIITDIDSLSEAYVFRVVEPNIDAIKDALNDGLSVPGAVLSNGSETISLRVK